MFISDLYMCAGVSVFVNAYLIDYVHRPSGRIISFSFTAVS